ncbi:hypothetical protein A1O7_02512 [Cladophialophora yegresii CBS 114405]|uniref:Uncharacterized protein n=1 Tax=Cladophialophora yegresii CBS 114405 TaxID=1182544 RepID=W9WUU3_9EURO|nr:uncharacterized protein A1O7_02512 [Cladophialophora yegresii CBS 114405]EXJ62079.1 hypothetical protein A1O7_02512 [Cladophialophora yegresii CBS 114405]
MPNFEVPLTIWEIRSITKAVLRARWCTRGWVRTFIDDMFLYNTVPMQYRNTGVRHFLFERDARFLQCPLDSFDDEIDQKLLVESEASEPFRLLLEKSLKVIQQGNPHPGNGWSCLDTLDFSDDEIWDDDQRSSGWLRAWIASDYYLYPEDASFKISPHVFRRAAAQDISSDLREQTGDTNSYALLYVAHLFDVDPQSLPLTDPILLKWAAEAKEDVEFYQQQWVESSGDLPWAATTRTRQEWERERHARIRSTFLYHMHLEVLRYITTGRLEPGSKGRSFDQSGRLKRFEDREIIDEERTSTEPP